MISIFVGVSQFGVFNIAKRASTVICYIILLELGISIPRYFAMNVRKNKKLAFEYYQTGMYLITITSFVAAIMALIFPDFIAKLLFGTSGYESFVIPMIIFSIGLCFNTFIFSAYRGAEFFYLYSIVQIVTQIVNMVVIFFCRNAGIAVILNYWGVSNIIISLVLITIFAILNSVPLFVKINRFRQRVKELLVYGVPRIFGDIIQFSYYLLPLMFVNKRFGNIESGLFSASTGILQSFLPFFSYIGIILLPKVSQALVDGKIEKVQKQINVLMVLYLLFAGIAVAIGSIFAKPIMILLYSSNYAHNLDIARILLITLIPRAQFLLLRNPIDAVSIKPYNTINLTLSMMIMIMVMVIAKNVYLIAWSFVISDLVLFICSYSNWRRLNRRSTFDGRI
jgi:O-antigen/teichoic acid export membrane protein